MNGPSPPPPLQFHGGLAGALFPFVVFLAGVTALALAGAPDERGFWPVILGALICGLLLAKDRTRFSEAVVASMSQEIVAVMILAWLLSGVLSVLLSASGLVASLVELARLAHLSRGLYVAVSFLACALVSTATGTSFGTILVCGPLLYPAGASTGADPAWLAGAILGGATFGDSISPISDTTIASSGTQRADIGGTVRSRIAYVWPPGIAAMLIAAVAGGGADTGNAVAQPGSLAALPMLLAPALVFRLLLLKRHLVEGLLFGILAAAAIGLALRTLTPGQLLFIDRAHFGARGLIVDGLERGVGVSVFTLLLMGLVGALVAAGIESRLIETARARATSPRAAEAWIVAAASVAVLLTTHSIVAILAVGSFARETGTRFGISAYRRANLLDTTVCTWPFLLPYFLPTILMSSATASGAGVGFPRVSPATAGLFNVYSWGLLAMTLLAVASGYGRRDEQGGGNA